MLHWVLPAYLPACKVAGRFRVHIYMLARFTLHYDGYSSRQWKLALLLLLFHQVPSGIGEWSCGIGRANAAAPQQ
jgi:hypothetical protein